MRCKIIWGSHLGLLRLSFAGYSLSLWCVHNTQVINVLIRDHRCKVKIQLVLVDLLIVAIMQHTGF